MTWTYTESPATSDRDWVRFEIGDTDTTDQLLSDEEIASLITDRGSKEAAALAAAEGLAAQFARKVTKAVGDLRINYSDLAKQYRELAKSLKTKAGLRKARPIAGGISISRKDTVEADTDRVKPWAERDQFRHPELNDDDATDP